VTRELRIESGPVVIVQTDSDPGDMGEPRIITEDGATVVFVPSFSYWPGDEPPSLVPHDHATLGCEYPCDVLAGTLEPAR
jgi:hypothetical protein